MKSFCKNCESLQPSSFRLEHDAETRKPYEDLCCNTCHFVVATVQGREAVAQPAQEPVAQWLEDAFREGWEAYRESEFASKITEDWAFGNSFANCRMIDLQQNTPPQPVQDVDYWIREATAARQAEMALRRELDAQPAQEPVAHVYLFDDDGRPLIAWDNAKGVQIGDKLYTAPPQRTWIWLSDADIADVIDTTCQYTCGYEEFLIKKAERKIRSMNNG